MSIVQTTDQAEEDLVEIASYIAQDSPIAADRFIAKVTEKYVLLASSPELGRKRDDLAAGLRSVPVGDYLIFYLPIKDGVVIVRLLSGHRDIEGVFG